MLIGHAKLKGKVFPKNEQMACSFVERYVLELNSFDFYMLVRSVKICMK